MEPMNVMFGISIGLLIVVISALFVYVRAFIAEDVKSIKRMYNDIDRAFEERIKYEKDLVKISIDHLKDLEKKDLDLIFEQSRRLNNLLDYLGLEEKKCDRAEIVKKK